MTAKTNRIHVMEFEIVLCKARQVLLKRRSNQLHVPADWILCPPLCYTLFSSHFIHIFLFLPTTLRPLSTNYICPCRMFQLAFRSQWNHCFWLIVGPKHVLMNAKHTNPIIITVLYNTLQLPIRITRRLLTCFMFYDSHYVVYVTNKKSFVKCWRRRWAQQVCTLLRRLPIKQFLAFFWPLKKSVKSLRVLAEFSQYTF